MGAVPKVICACDDPDMVHRLLEKTKYGVSKQNVNYGLGTRHRRGVVRVNNALIQDSRFKEIQVRGIRLMVGFQFLNNDEG